MIGMLDLVKELWFVFIFNSSSLKIFRYFLNKRVRLCIGGTDSSIVH